MAFIFLLFLPLLLLTTLLVLFFKKRREGILSALIFFSVTAITAIWMVTRSHSSTAAIGLIFVPLYSSASGFLGLHFGMFYRSKTKWLRITSWVAIVISVALLGFFINRGTVLIHKSAEVVAANKVNQEIYIEHVRNIQKIIKENKGHESEALDKAMEKNMDDYLFTIAALETEFVPVERLIILADKYPSSVIRNVNTPAQVIEHLFKTMTDTSYLTHDFARGKNTPSHILAEIYKDPKGMTRPDNWLAKNRNTPKDILQTLAESKSYNVLQMLMQNEALDCELVKTVKKAFPTSDRPSDEFLHTEIPLKEKALCATE